MTGNRLRSKAGKVGQVMVFILFFTCMSVMGNENPVKLTIKENGTRIDLQRGQLLEIALPASLGTGFSWRVTNVPDALRTKGQPETRKPESEEPKPGRTEYQIFRFVAGRAGTGKLELQYVRPWEKGTPPANTYSLTINVP